MAVDHYENFPVASVLLPARFRRPVELVYRFARTADDYADEGDLVPEERLRQLTALDAALDEIEAGRSPSPPWLAELGALIREHGLPLGAFRDLLSAFAQDVTRTRYARFDEVLDYCRRSADPVGRILLALYRADSAENLRRSDSICTALQLVNFLQDVAIDLRKNRVYLPLDELASHGLAVSDIARGEAGPRWAGFMTAQVSRARALLYAGKPLGRALPGRLGLELRMIIQGGGRILDKIDRVRGDVFRHRPMLKWHDWPLLALSALIDK